MATGTDAVWPFAKSRRITTSAICASSVPARVRTCAAKLSELVATAGNRAAKSGGGIEFAARARSASEVTPQALQRAAANDDSGSGLIPGPTSLLLAEARSLARSTALTAARPIQ